MELLHRSLLMIQVVGSSPARSTKQFKHFLIFISIILSKCLLLYRDNYYINIWKIIDIFVNIVIKKLVIKDV